MILSFEIFSELKDSIIHFIKFCFKNIMPNKLKQWQIKINRLNTNDEKEIQDFIEVYEETFPFDGSNYTSAEMLDIVNVLQHPKMNKKYVASDNIILVAKFDNKVIGFIACFYYPQKKYGIIGYFGKSKLFIEEGKYVSSLLLKKLKNILIKQHACKLLLFELEPTKKEKAKATLFKLFAKNLGMETYELDFPYYRPKLNLDDSNPEQKLTLLITPLNNKKYKTFSKKQVLDILKFLHFYCYGDYYNSKDNNHLEFQNYLKSRIEYYERVLLDKVNLV